MRRRQAAPYLRAIAPRHDKAVQAALLAAAKELEAECASLDRAAEIIPPGCDEAVHWAAENVVRLRKILGDAEGRHGRAVAALEAALGAGAPKVDDADDAERLVVEGNGIVAEQALARLVGLAPSDIDRRLARLWDKVPDAKKEMADGPVHRQILFALDKFDTDAATEAIAKAISFEGKGDDVPWAVTRWACEMYWARKGKKGRAVWERAIASPLPHVREHAAAYIGRIGDKALLPRVADLKASGAFFARVLLGDESAWPLLVAELGGERPTQAYLLMVEIGAPSEAHLLPALGDPNPNVVVGAAVTLSRIGSEASLAPLEACAKAHADVPRLARALADLRRRLGK